MEIKNYYRNKDSYKVTETSAELQLERLLDHTIARLLHYLKEVLETMNDDERYALLLNLK